MGHGPAVADPCATKVESQNSRGGDCEEVRNHFEERVRGIMAAEEQQRLDSCNMRRLYARVKLLAEREDKKARGSIEPRAWAKT